MPRFHLTRHYMLTSSLVFLLFGALLYQVDHLRSQAVHAIQAEESRALKELRDDLTRTVTEAAQRDLVALQEQSSVNMARLLVNGLWNGLFASYLEQAQAVDFSRCGAPDPQAGEAAQRERQACHRVIGQQLARLPAFALLDSAVRTALQDTQVYRLKIFDLRGITIYSSDDAALGEDRSLSPGWRGAARDGVPGSHLTRRNALNPLHLEAESRDIVNTYLPVFGEGEPTPVAVIETYSDVRSFLEQLSAFTSNLSLKAAVREQGMQQRLDQERALLDMQGHRATLVVLALTLVVYVALLMIVRRAQHLIEQQAEQMQNTRTHLMQTEKMAMLGQMVAGVAHQLNTPLAYCRANLHCFSEAFDRVVARVLAQRADATTVMLTDPDETSEAMRQDAIVDRDVDDVRLMVEDTRNGVRMMEELVQQLRSFTRVDQAAIDVVDLNAALSSAVYMARAVLPPKIRIEERYASLPRMVVRVSQINQAVLNLLMNAGQAVGEQGCITVSTRLEGAWVVIEVSDDGCGMSAEVQSRVFEAFYTTKSEGTGLGLYLVRDIVQGHGGSVLLSSAPGSGTSVGLRLPVSGRTAP